MSELIVVVGPIASGKSTVANTLAERLRDAGRRVAVVDLDDVVDTIGGFGALGRDGFHQAQIVNGELVAAWLRQDIDVIAHGPFFAPEETALLLAGLPADATCRRVYLSATLEAALARVSNDPDRGLSKHPGFLRHAYERVDELRGSMPENDWTFDSVSSTADEIVAALAAALAEPF